MTFDLNTFDKPTGFCPECGEKFSADETMPENPEGEECDQPSEDRHYGEWIKS